MREMENGHGILADRFSVLAVSDSNASNNDSLFQVMKAVEVAETTIKHQVEENKRLRIELQQKNQELEKYACNSDVQEPCTVDPRHENACGNYQAQHSFHSAENRSDGKILSGILNVHPGGLVPAEHTDVSQFSSPATSSSSCRYPLQGEHDPQVSLSGHGLMPIAEANNANNISKQDLVHKIREHEEEIMLLRKHLADYSIKEAQIRNENYVLEKRIAHMRLAFDQQQQDLVDAASKALTYRQDIIEENIRLTYALQVAQQERSTFVSSLLPLLTEYSLQPSLSDAQSIVSSLKVLFKHLQEKLNVTEAKMKESQYQLRPWHSDVSQSGFLPQSPSPTSIADKSGLQLVRQEVYSESKLPVSSAYTQTNTERDIRSNHQSAMTGIAANLTGINEVGRYSPPLASRIAAGPDGSGQFAQADAHATHYGNEMNKQVAFRDPVSSSEMDDPDTELQHNEKDAASNWVSGNINYTNALDDPGSSYSPYLPPVLEEPSSSFSEAADDDPLPAIEDLQISGEAFPGRELQASGYSINGTTSCNFEWVRHMEDGSFNYIEGAKQPSYLVTADDVGTYLAIEVQPLDNRKRKGELVKVFSNEHRKITCDREMHSYIEKTLYTGHVSYKVSLSAGYLDIWEPSTLSIKRDAYSIKCIGSSDVVVTEKFSPSTSVTIPYGHPTEFSIIDSNGVERLLRAEGSATDISCSRDTIVLTVRVFAVRAVDRKKGKKRSLFFHK